MKTMEIMWRWTASKCHFSWKIKSGIRGRGEEGSNQLEDELQEDELAESVDDNDIGILPKSVIKSTINVDMLILWDLLNLNP